VRDASAHTFANSEANSGSNKRTDGDTNELADGRPNTGTDDCYTDGCSHLALLGHHWHLHDELTEYDIPCADRVRWYHDRGMALQSLRKRSHD
jgi:hypothetical protein